MLAAIEQQRHVAAVINHDDDNDVREFDRCVRAAHAAGAAGEAVLLRGDPSELPRLLATQADRFLRRHRHLHPGVRVHPGGSADLILLVLPAALLLDRRHEHNEQWHTRFDARDVLTAAATVLRPGGYLVATTNGDERSGRDLGSEAVSLCENLGLRYWQHIVALLVPIDAGQLKPPRRRRGVAESTLPRIVHQNVHVFRKPTAADTHTNSQTTDARRAA